MGNITIEDLNFEEAKEYIGGVIFVAVLMVIGFIGNLHVLIVYTFFMKPSNHRIFILVLGTLDFITCVVGMPFIIVDLRNPLTFTISSACKILRFINYFICTSSALTLVVIAVDRYRKICVPFGKQITERLAKISCLIVLGVALLLSWPAPVLYGIAHIETDANLTGTRCWTEDKPNFVKLQGYFNALLILVVMVTFFTLVVLYVLIGRVISKHNTFQQKEKDSPVFVTTTSNSHVMSELSSDSTGSTRENNLGEVGSSRQETPTNELSSSRQEAPTNELGSIRQEATTNDLGSIRQEAPTIERTDRKNSQAPSTKYEVNRQSPLQQQNKTSKNDQAKNFDRAKRTTLMFLLITVVFFLSYIPHLSLKIVVFMNESFLPNASFAGKVVYHTFVWCFFVNNVTNCFVYGFCDIRFRQAVQNMYRTVFRCN